MKTFLFVRSDSNNKQVSIIKIDKENPMSRETIRAEFIGER